MRWLYFTDAGNGRFSVSCGGTEYIAKSWDAAFGQGNDGTPNAIYETSGGFGFTPGIFNRSLTGDALEVTNMTLSQPDGVVVSSVGVIVGSGTIVPDYGGGSISNITTHPDIALHLDAGTGEATFSVYAISGLSAGSYRLALEFDTNSPDMPHFKLNMLLIVP